MPKSVLYLSSPRRKEASYANHHPGCRHGFWKSSSTLLLLRSTGSSWPQLLFVFVVGFGGIRKPDTSIPYTKRHHAGVTADFKGRRKMKERFLISNFLLKSPEGKLFLFIARTISLKRVHSYDVFSTLVLYDMWTTLWKLSRTIAWLFTIWTALKNEYLPAPGSTWAIEETHGGDSITSSWQHVVGTPMHHTRYIANLQSCVKLRGPQR